ncbi:MAG: hypothetical protein F2838_08120 [Actinobacteria bacterium]|nr:hypothetical protein [Actinomycetota bacterium]
MSGVVLACDGLTSDVGAREVDIDDAAGEWCARDRMTGVVSMTAGDPSGPRGRHGQGRM